MRPVRPLSILVLSCGFWACSGDGGGGGGSSSSTPPPGLGSGGAPQVSGATAIVAAGPEVVIAPGVSDPEGDPITYTWTLVRGPTINGRAVSFPLNVTPSDDSGTTAFRFPTNGEYILRLRSSDGSTISTETFTVMLDNPQVRDITGNLRDYNGADLIGVEAKTLQLKWNYLPSSGSQIILENVTDSSGEYIFADLIDGIDAYVLTVPGGD